jgi:hypothetical protein
MPDTEAVEQTESAPAPAQPAAQPRRGRAIAGVAVVALIGFIAISHAVGVLIPLLVLAGLAVLFALAGLVRGLRHVSGLKSARGMRISRRTRSLRRPGGGRPRHLAPFPGARRTGGPAGRKRGATGNRTRGKGLHLPGRGKGALAPTGARALRSRKSRAGQPGTGLGTSRRGRTSAPTGAKVRRGLFGRHGRATGTAGKRAGQNMRGTHNRRTLGQRLHLPGANRRAARRQQQRQGNTKRVSHSPRGLFGRIRARRAARRSPGNRPVTSSPPARRRGYRRVLAGAAAALALPFVLPFTARRAWKRRKLRKAAQAPHGRPAPWQRKPSRWQRLWDRLRRKPQPQPAPPPPEPTPVPPKPTPPQSQQAPAVPRVKQPPAGGTQPGRKRTVSSQVDAATEAIDQHIGGYEPQTPTDLGMFLQALPQLFESLGTALSHVADTLGDQFPVEPALPEQLREIGASAAGLADQATEAHSVHRNAHEKELERLENPRTNEQFWDVQSDE